MEDYEIIDLFFSRTETAIAETMDKYGPYLRTIVNHILRSAEDSEEVVSDVYLAAWNRIPPERPESLKHYLSRIARNLSFKRVEYLSAVKRYSNAEQLLSELEECIPANHADPAEIVEAKELGASLNQFLSRLTREDCGLFVSRYYYALTIQELSQKYVLPPRHVRYRLEKLRKELRVFLQQEEINA